MNAIHLGTWDLLAAALLIVLDAALSLALRLGLHRQILVAAVRMVVQLTIVGLVLRQVFATASAAASTCSRARTCRGACRHVSASVPSSADTRSAPWTTGSAGFSVVRRSSRVTEAPSSTADARAPRSADSVDTSALRRRRMRWPSSRSTAERASATASATPGRFAS